jgi:hypothetical protein
MAEVEIEKTCVSCGADVTRRPRHKNRHGEYLCPACREALRSSSSRSSSRRRTRLCACCDAEVASGQYHRNRHGEYICHSCRRKGKRQSRHGMIERKQEALHSDVAAVQEELQQLSFKVSCVLVAAGLGVLVVFLRWFVPR